MPLTNGQTFAGYTIIRLLGSGGMGEVYLAEHPRLPRRDALKLLPHDWSADAEYRARFNREADLASTLWHPHIVGVHDRGEEEGQLWISMDFVDGLDAARLLADRYPAGMPVEEVARIVTAVASALDYAHKQGLLHRDVKPANIMITHLDDEGEQRILLTDFGIARNINDISGLTKTNMTVGTVAYCAPEQLLGEDVDGRADQYSLAATAFHLLTGCQLFPNSNPAVVISHHLNVPPPALADSRPSLAKIDPVLAIGLAKRPEDRYRRCADFAHALNEQIDSAGAPTQAAPTSPAPVPPQDDSGDTKSTKARLIAVAAAVVAVLLIAGLIVIVTSIWFRQTRHEPPGTTSPPLQESAPAATLHPASQYGTQIVLPFPASDRPYGVAVDPGDNLYVGTDSSRVLKLAGGSATPTELPFDGIRNTLGVAVDVYGDLYITDSSDRVLKLAHGGAVPTDLPVAGLNSPVGIAVDSEGNTYVTDQLNHRVLRLAAGATTPTKLPFSGLRNPAGVAVDTAGNLYVCDLGNNRVFKLAADANAPTELPFTGLTGPYGVAVDNRGNIYVAASGNNQVLKLAVGTTAPTELPFSGLNYPVGVAVDAGGNVYVTDSQNNRVLKLPASST
jgi:serine/threonine protein kinase/DNA-binding beta-propeller fold protein YncE